MRKETVSRDISAAVKARMAEAGISVRKMALYIGISERSLYRRLQGVTPWSADDITQLQVLGVLRLVTFRSFADRRRYEDRVH